MKQRIQHIIRYSKEAVHIAPLAVFRVLFGGVMFTSILRFMLKGWVNELYIQPKFFFTYYGFEWVKPLGETGMYAIFGLMLISSLGIMFGAWYRLFSILFFVSFTYVELIDKTNYLNHYYFISIVSMLMMLLPTHRYFSLDALRKPSIRQKHIPRWVTGIIKLQLGLVYFYAGMAKLNYNWLFEAMPLKLWLPANNHLPVIGWLFDYTFTAYAFSWAGALYDLTIPFFLLSRKTRPFAYVAVIVFHVLTHVLFQIGMFPYIMILATLIFFPEDFHKKVIRAARQLFQYLFGHSPSLSVGVGLSGAPLRSGATHSPTGSPTIPNAAQLYRPLLQKLLLSFLAIHFVIQVLFPWRFLLYPGNLFWNEEGFRFSWRVMLMEKAGYTIFHVKDPATGREGEVINSDFLTPNQEKMMATQPDMILQFAHFIKEEYQKKGIKNPEVRAEAYVTLNGSGTRLFLDPEVNLANKKDSFQHKDWVLAFKE